MSRKVLLFSLLASASVPTCAQVSFAAAMASPALPDDPQAGDDQDKVRSDIVVTGRRDDGYRAEDTGALGIDLTVKELPATINVVTDQFIRDTGAHRLSDIIAYIPGVVNNEKSTSLAEYYIVRGFGTSLTYLNGVRQTYSNTRRGIATIDRVEIVKGPSGAEAGVADPGGTINILTKLPQPTFGASFNVGAGDYHYVNVDGDITGPIAFDGALSPASGGCRIALSYRLRARSSCCCRSPA